MQCYNDCKAYFFSIGHFDPFGKGGHIYHFDNLCREDPSIRLEDGTEKIFLNTKETKEAEASLDDVDEELRSLLKYFESQVPQDDFTTELDEAVAAARLHKEWRREYMKLELMMRDSRREGRKEGRLEGRKEGKLEGRREGKKEGRLEGKIDLVCRKLAKGKMPEAIAEDLEEDLSEVQRICDAAAKYAPDYDIEKILQEFMAGTF